MANSGKNYFEEGVTLYDGVLELVNAGVISAQKNESDPFSSMTVTFDGNSGGAGRELVVTSDEDANGEQVTNQELSNRIIVTANTQDSILTAQTDTVLGGAVDRDDKYANDAVIVVGRNLDAGADGGAKLTLNVEGIAGGYGTITLKNANASQPDILLHGNSEIELAGARNIYIHQGINDDGAGTNAVITKKDAGTDQIHGGANNFNGTANINEGCFRVLRKCY